MPSISESSLQRKIIKALRKRGWRVWNLTGGPYQEAGLPDLLALKWGRYIWVEVKLPGEKLMPHQKSMHREIRNHSGTVGVARSRRDAIDIAALRCGHEEEFSE